ncbi:aminotransferase class I/II-fold pyridoxal phosphate-dependent enzyme [Virgibacillus sp. NKC19-16]|uniref:aminotransferase class I/II-fold pyridoxal phosphate-dependent enzyme n=1 Tax=Virgibacillus salidurans TaxID=2831673 RepID=UPI001F47508A|nr:aminotransferase class I/II-fold pyridoxal phosphate-dependent enzyme [Virgibacillus sp. NKC19-16]UJL46456.1 aminotransferase class I/II-fold pyridoxal phosphate-dependent enzyme [Virgibacillus sp. NKC19-16]
MNHHHTPLFQTLKQFNNTSPTSFHVPGHKNGLLFPTYAREFFDSILKLDMTELPGLDDLHAPTEAIAEAENLAADFFQADHTFFLVGGSTAGNLAMILATCNGGDKVIVQRNSHKSVMNGLELSGARPVFIAPEYDREVDRYISPSQDTLRKALHEHPDAKAVVLTYPDYFGKTYAIKEMIDAVHAYHMPVLVDEAHGVHFSVGDSFPPSALDLGADVVVQSAHKMAPAMTMASFLHMKSRLLSKDRIAHYLQMIQSSSPSYPLMASLDIARAFLAIMKTEEIDNIIYSASMVREILQASDHWRILSTDDPLKITLHMKNGIAAKDIADLFEKQNIYPELVTHNQILFIHGLTPFRNFHKLKKAVQNVGDQLKNQDNRATIEITKLFTQDIQELTLDYQEMNQLNDKQFSFHEAIGHIAAEAVIPYPPGIPVILKGEKITGPHIEIIETLVERGVKIQQRDPGIRIYT